MSDAPVARAKKKPAPWRGRMRVKDARTKLIPPIRCTDEERAAIKAAADQAGLSVGAFLRALALGTAGLGARGLHAGGQRTRGLRAWGLTSGLGAWRLGAWGLGAWGLGLA